MELIKRYVHSVGRGLPEKHRADIEEELESLILDTLESRTPEGRTPSEKEVIAVLKEFGHPREVAARYLPPKYLVGPELFHTWLMITGIVTGAVALGLVVSVLARFLVEPFQVNELLIRLARIIPTFFSAALSVVGAVTIVFAVIERLMPQKEKESLKLTGNDWNPRDLPEVPRSDERIIVSEQVAAIVLTLILLALFNLFSLGIGLNGQGAGSEWYFIALLARDALAKYLPWLNALWVLTLVYHAILLYTRRLPVGMRIFELVLALGGIILVASMIAGPPLLEAGQILPGSTDWVGKLEPLINMLNSILKIGLIAIILGLVSGMAVKTYRLFKSRKA